MIIAITERDHTIFVHKSFEDMDKALIAQTVMELELLKAELKELYFYGDIQDEI